MAISVKICLLFFLGCIFIIQSRVQSIRTFRCNNNGKYITNNFFCDDDNDCPDTEDEGTGCKKNICGSGKFSCDSNQCKNITVRCNTVKDCEDGTDELNCGDEINVKNCTGKDKFLCHDGIRCLGIEYTCDSFCNCFDCSDENDNCSRNDYDLLKKCPHAYFTTPNGPQCLCDSTDDQSTVCKNIQDCDFRSSCNQRCIKYKDRNQCTCFEGFHFANNTDGGGGQTCRSNDGFGNVVYFATFLTIKSLNVTSKNATVVQNEVHNCTALFAANNYVYYATLLDNKGTIFKSSATGGKAEAIIETDFPVTSIAVDYVTNNVYFTSNGSISVCKNNGLICWKLECCGINYVTVAPKLGLMFYLQRSSLYAEDSALLMKSNMDGSNATVLANDEYRGNISITVDESEKKVYLLEMGYMSISSASRVRIHRSTIDGNIREIHSLRRSIRSFTVITGDVFFTIDQENDIYYSTYYSYLRTYSDEGDTLYRDDGTSTTKFLYAYNGLLQRSSENPCPKSCSGLCLIKPSTRPFSTLGYTCLCNNFTSTSDNRWCSNIPPTASGHSLLVIFILAFVVLGLGAVGYYMFLKQNWYQYFMTLRHWQQDKLDQRIVSDDIE